MSSLSHVSQDFRLVAVVALDSRRPKKESHKTGDQFYDPPFPSESKNEDDWQKIYTRLRLRRDDLLREIALLEVDEIMVIYRQIGNFEKHFSDLRIQLEQDIKNLEKQLKTR